MDSLQITLSEGALAPERSHPLDAGYDLFAYEPLEQLWHWDRDNFLDIYPETVEKFLVGFKIALPESVAGLVLPRSGLGSRGIVPANTPGLIDPGYRGEVIVALANHSSRVFRVRPYDRIAQLLLVPFFTPTLEEISGADFAQIPTDTRGEGGFGSSGK